MKAEAIRHSKMRRLARILNIPIWGARGLMESVWHTAVEEAPVGNIGKLSNQDIADAVGWDGNADALVRALVDAGWLDEDPLYRLLIHDWDEHCPDYVHARLARKRSLFANGRIPNLTKLLQAERAGLNTAEFTLPLATETSTAPSSSAQNADPAAAGSERQPVASEQADPVANGGQRQPLARTQPNQAQPYPTTAAAVRQPGVRAQGADLDAVNGQHEDGFGELIGTFLASGKKLNEHDIEKAQRLWLNFDAAEHAQILAHLKVAIVDGTWSDARHTPMPASYLQSKAWSRVGPGRILPDPSRSRAERGQAEAERMYKEKHHREL